MNCLKFLSIWLTVILCLKLPHQSLVSWVESLAVCFDNSHYNMQMWRDNLKVSISLLTWHLSTLDHDMETWWSDWLPLPAVSPVSLFLPVAIANGVRVTVLPSHRHSHLLPQIQLDFLNRSKIINPPACGPWGVRGKPVSGCQHCHIELASSLPVYQCCTLKREGLGCSIIIE